MQSAHRADPHTLAAIFTSCERTALGKAALLFLYLCLNVSLNILNKYILSIYGFGFPVLLSIAHVSFGFVALAPFMASKAYREQHAPALQKHWVSLLVVGSFFAVNVGATTASLLTISLSLNQIIRAAIPAFTACGAVFIDNRAPSRHEFVALSVLMTGVAIAVWDSSSSSSTLNGVVMCLLGTISNGLMVAGMSKLMLTDKLDVLRLVWYTAPVALCLLVPFHLHYESERYAAYAASQGSMYLGVLLVSCTNALAYNLVHALVVKVTSSVMTVMVGEMKIVVILLLAAIVLGEASVWTLKLMIGCTLAVLGFCAYSHFRMMSGAPYSLPIIKGVPELSPMTGVSEALSVRTPLSLAKARSGSQP